VKGQISFIYLNDIFFFLNPYTYLKFRLFTPLHWKHLKFKPNCRQTITGGFCAIEGKHQTTL